MTLAAYGLAAARACSADAAPSAAAVLFTAIGDGDNLMGMGSFWQMGIEGLLIAGVVYLDNVLKRRVHSL